MTDIEIAQAHEMKKIVDVAAKAGIDEKHLELYGNYKAKLDLTEIRKLPRKAKLILVTAISPTPAGEGKTTTSVGLGRRAATSSARTPWSACASPLSAPCSASRAALPAAATLRSSPWRTSTCTSPATSTPSALPTTCWPLMLDNHIQQGNVLGIDPRQHRVEARCRYERPPAPPHHRRSWRQGQRRAPRGRL